MEYLKRFADRRNRNLVPDTGYFDKEPDVAPSEENGEDETLLYPQTEVPRSQHKHWVRYICTAALITLVMACCFLGGFLLKGMTQPRLWNFDNYDTRKFI